MLHVNLQKTWLYNNKPSYANPSASGSSLRLKKNHINISSFLCRNSLKILLCVGGALRF